MPSTRGYETSPDDDSAPPPRARPRVTGSSGPPAAGEPSSFPPPIERSGLVPRALVDDRAAFVVRHLQKHGHEAWLVGGCVRDLLAGLEPKDFDVATDAWPNRIKRLFRSARVIGRRFRLVHILFPGNHVVETSTFRADPACRGDANHREEPDDASDAGEAPRNGGRRSWRDSEENVFGTAPEDAHRRDFTINALYYDPVGDRVIDYVGGLADMEARVVRSIGEPACRIAEDPVRMLRAVHFAERMHFDLDPALEAAIAREAARLAEASNARLYVELIKLLTRGRARPTFRRLSQLGLLRVWLPELDAALNDDVVWPERTEGSHAEASRGEPERLPVGHATWTLLGAADEDGLAAKGAPESLALALLFGPLLLSTWHDAGGIRDHAHFTEHVEETFGAIQRRMSIPRWAATEMRDILWLLEDLRHPPQKPRRLRTVLGRRAFPVALAYFRLDLLARNVALDEVDAWVERAEEAGVNLSLSREAPPRDEARRGGGRGGSRRGSRDGRRERGWQRDARDDAGGANEDEVRSGAPRRGRGRRRGGRGRRRPDVRPGWAPEADAFAPPPPRRDD